MDQQTEKRTSSLASGDSTTTSSSNVPAAYVMHTIMPVELMNIIRKDILDYSMENCMRWIAEKCQTSCNCGRMDIVLKDTVVAPVVPVTNRQNNVDQLIEKMNTGATCNQPVVLCSVETTEKEKATDVDGGQTIMKKSPSLVELSDSEESVTEKGAKNKAMISCQTIDDDDDFDSPALSLSNDQKIIEQKTTLKRKSTFRRSSESKKNFADDQAKAVNGGHPSSSDTSGPSSSNSIDGHIETPSETIINAPLSPMLVLKDRESLFADNDDMMIRLFAMKLKSIPHAASATEEGRLRLSDPLRYERYRARQALILLGL